MIEIPGVGTLRLRRVEQSLADAVLAILDKRSSDAPAEVGATLTFELHLPKDLEGIRQEEAIYRSSGVLLMAQQQTERGRRLRIVAEKGLKVPLAFRDWLVAAAQVWETEVTYAYKQGEPVTVTIASYRGSDLNIRAMARSVTERQKGPLQLVLDFTGSPR